MENSMSQMDDLCKKIEYYVNLGISKVCDAAFRSKIKSRYSMLQFEKRLIYFSDFTGYMQDFKNALHIVQRLLYEKQKQIVVEEHKDKERTFDAFSIPNQPFQ